MIKTNADRLITIDGLELARDKYQELGREMAERVKALQDARAHGDLSENAEYKSALERLEEIQIEVKEVQDVLNDHVIATTPPDTSVARFGAVISLQDQDTAEQINFRIGGKVEARYGDAFLYFKAPLPQAVIAKSIGSVIYYNEHNYKIVNLHYPDSATRSKL